MRIVPVPSSSNMMIRPHSETAGILVMQTLASPVTDYS